MRTYAGWVVSAYVYVRCIARRILSPSPALRSLQVPNTEQRSCWHCTPPGNLKTTPGTATHGDLLRTRGKSQAGLVRNPKMNTRHSWVGHIIVKFSLHFDILYFFIVLGQLFQNLHFSQPHGRRESWLEERLLWICVMNTFSLTSGCSSFVPSGKNIFQCAYPDSADRITVIKVRGRCAHGDNSISRTDNTEFENKGHQWRTTLDDLGQFWAQNVFGNLRLK